MKAMLCKEYGPPESLVFEEIECPPLGKGQVRIAVKAAGVNFPDSLVIQGQYQFKPDLPFSPGAEASGDVTEVGVEVTTVKVGDRVVWFSISGGYAEEIVAEQSDVMPISDSMDYETAAGMFLTYGTSYHALLQRAKIQPGETLLVLGAAGGVG
ncbi:MAG TPA: NADPH:quinone oxidoreductase family protein, partial [Sneathiellales bacterium]|nr:NADPH:quinone oxidoreductase family protein [Sneathiellales bacterium]